MSYEKKKYAIELTYYSRFEVVICTVVFASGILLHNGTTRQIAKTSALDEDVHSSRRESRVGRERRLRRSALLDARENTRASRDGQFSKAECPLVATFLTMSREKNVNFSLSLSLLGIIVSIFSKW